MNCTHVRLEGRNAELYEYWRPNAKKDCYFNKIAILFFALNSLEIKGLSAFQQQIRKTYLSIKQEGLLHCYHSC